MSAGRQSPLQPPWQRHRAPGSTDTTPLTSGAAHPATHSDALQGWGWRCGTPLAATGQAAREELWLRFAPCRRPGWLAPPPEPCRLPRENTNPFQSQRQSWQSPSPRPAKGSAAAKAAQGSSHAPLQAQVPQDTCERARSVRRTGWQAEWTPSRK